MRQKILWESPFPPALGGPFAAPLFALLSAVQNSLWMRYAALLPLPWFAIRLCLLYTIRAPLSSIIFTQQADKCAHIAHFVGRGYIRAGQFPTSERVVFTLNVRWCPVGIYAHPTVFFHTSRKNPELLTAVRDLGYLLCFLRCWPFRLKRKKAVRFMLSTASNVSTASSTMHSRACQTMAVTSM